MKLAEQFIDGDGSTFHVKTTFDAQPTLDNAATLRSAEAGMAGDYRLVGVVPGWLVAEWMKEAGLAHNDNEGRKDLIRKKMLSGEFSKLRVWGGNY